MVTSRESEPGTANGGSAVEHTSAFLPSVFAGSQISIFGIYQDRGREQDPMVDVPMRILLISASPCLIRKTWLTCTHAVRDRQGCRPLCDNTPRAAQHAPTKEKKIVALRYSRDFIGSMNID